jgi:hypothetical protein
MTDKLKEMFKELNENKVGLIQRDKDNNIVQLRMTEQQSDMLQMFILTMNNQNPIEKASSEFDLILKNQQN